MVSNKRKAWDEAVERGLISEDIEYYEITEKEILALLDSRCVYCDAEGELRDEDDKVLCDDCYQKEYSIPTPETLYSEEDEPEDSEEDSEEDEPEDSEEDEPEDSEEDEPEPEPVVVAKVAKPIVVKPSKPSARRITRNKAVDGISVGAKVSFKCKPGSNIGTYAGDMAVGLVMNKKSGIKSYTGKLTKKLKKDIQLGKIILLR